MNIRWFMLKGGLVDHPFYIVNGALMALTFFAFRIVNGVGIMYVSVWRVWFESGPNSARDFSDSMGWVGVAIAPLVVMFYVLWCYWFALICQGILAAVRKDESRHTESPGVVATLGSPRSLAGDGKKKE